MREETIPISQKLDVAWIVLGTILRSERPHEGDLLFTIESINKQLLNILQEDGQKLSSESITTLVEIVLMTEPSFSGRKDNLHWMVLVLSRHQPEIIEDVERSLKHLLRCDGRDEMGMNLLHFACYALHDSETLSIVRFLLTLGADPNAVENGGFSPLHLLVHHDLNLLALEGYEETRDATARLLLAFGAHLDMTNNAGMTPAYLWLENSYRIRENVVWNDLPDWCKEGVPKLSCLCARVIRRHQVPCNEGDLPAELFSFVSIY